MSVTDAGGLAVSFFALGIAIYGIFERQRAVYAAVRVRITELLDDVEGLNVDEDKYLERAWGQDGDQEAKASSGFVRYSLIGRRALLTYQALALIHRLTRSSFGRSTDLHLTPGEYVSLAYSLVRLGDVAGARVQYETALASVEETTDRVHIAARIGLANCLYDLGQPAAGRKQFAEAVRLHSGDLPGQQMAFDVCLNFWLPRELQAGSEGDPATAVRAGRAILDRATQVAQRAAWALESQMALRRRATRTVYVNGQYAEEVVGYEDEGASPGSQGRATTTAAPPQRDAP